MLNRNLRQFYAELMAGKGASYSKRSLVNIRARLNRYFALPPFNHALNLMHDRKYQGSNQVFYGTMHALRQAERDRTQHKNAVSEADMRKLHSCGVLGMGDPVSLQHHIYVEIVLHFLQEGAQGAARVEKVDSDARSYMTLAYTELEKKITRVFLNVSLLMSQGFMSRVGIGVH